MLLKIASLSAASAALALNSDYHFQAWKSQHGIQYQNSVEDDIRYQIFAESRKFVEQHNERAAQGLETFTVSLNKFAATSESEFERMYLSKVRDVSDPVVGLNYPCGDTYFQNDGSTAPSALSYVNGESATGDVRVTMVKDQGSCGSCWSFGASAAIEALLCQQGSKDCTSWTGLATQQMVDCASYTRDSTDPNVIDLFPYDNHGCNGGLEPNAMRYVQLNGGQMNWDDYPYISGQTKTEQTCAYDSSNSNLDIVNGCGMTQPGDETDLMNGLSQIGPMSVAIDASGRAFSLYSGGVYTSSTCSNTRLNHAVTAVGYGRYLDGQNYWEIKNSWGTGWGMGGYVLMSKDNGNMCGVASEAHYVF